MKYLITLIFCSLLPFTVMGGPKNKTIRINKMYSGKQVLKIKVLMSKQHANVKVEKKDVVGVKVTGKSQHGGGQVSLLIGARTSKPKIIDGLEHEFMNKNQESLYRILILNPNKGNKSDGNWQLKLNGNIFIQSVTLVIKGRKSDIDCVVDPRGWGRVTGYDLFYVEYKGKRLMTVPVKPEQCKDAQKSYIAKKRKFCLPTTMEMFYHPYNLKTMKTIKNKYGGQVAAPVPYGECVQFIKKGR